MLNLVPHHRFHVPNTLAIFAALLLLITSFVGFESNQDINSSDQDVLHSLKVNTNTDEGIDDSAEPRRRGLNLALLLFRRG